MKSIRFAIALVGLLAVGAVGASAATASFGIAPGTFDALVLDESGHAMMQAGGHPFKDTTGFELNTVIDPGPGEDTGLPIPDGGHLRNVKVEVPPGLVGNPLATPTCSAAEFHDSAFDICPDSTQVGIGSVDLNLFGGHYTLEGAIYNLEPPPGQPAEFAFWAYLVPIHITASVRSNGDYGLDVHVDNIDESSTITATHLTFWGNPASDVHDMERGHALFGMCGDTSPKPCPSDAPEVAFLTNPVNCEHGPFVTNGFVESWEGATDSDSILSHDDLGPSGVTRCDRVPFQPEIDSKPTTNDAASPTGLDFELNVPDAGILNPDGIAQSQIKKAVVRMPAGVSLNPSAGEGLGVCTPADWTREDLETEPGAGCPNNSKLGSVSIETPLLREHLEGSVYLAKSDDPKTAGPGAENPFDSLISVYLVVRSVERGIVIKSAGKVVPDERTGQIVATFDNLPQLPFSSLKIHFREGQRSPLVSPPNCGTYATEAELTPWSDQSRPRTIEDQFVISKGVGGSPCASGGAPPFHPNIQAGTLNNNAGAFSPFYLRMFRSDDEQEITNFSADLPIGMTAKLAGIPKCSDAALAKAAANTGLEEKENPSCPAASQVGHATVGYGVGTVLNYSPGKVYLAGPYKGAPVSIATVTSALIGPFDVGTVIVRSAFRVDGEIGQVHVDSKGSDPIPHILKGILLHLRDIRLYMDRPNFTLNPTSCDRMNVQALITGSGTDFVSSADDVGLPVTTPFQAAGCGLLKFKPKLSFRLKGGAHRGDYPALTATLRARKGDANMSKALVTLPHSEFLAQEHIRTVCTRVQFAADNCPAASIYGRARAVTPLLDEPLEGPVYLRSSDHPLPDLVADLGGEIQVTLVGRIDSVRQQIRTSFDVVPDVPVTKFTLKMQGGKKGLLVNSRNLCVAPGRATVKLGAQNGKASVSRPLVKTKCRKAKKR